MIELKNVVYKYDDADTPAVEDVSFTISDGEFFAIVGHNGSGKSTLAKHINALLLPTEGTVLVDGMDTKDDKLTLEIRQKVGMVFQNPDNQLVTTVVEEDIAFGPENMGVEPHEIRERVDKALADVGMTSYAKSAPHMLSGGQKQRIAIAGTLAMRPKVMVLDEATAMLDPKGRRDVLEIVHRMNRENGITVVMITQYMEEAINADRVAVMSGGKLIALDTPRNVFSKAEILRKHRLDVPAMAELRDRLIKDGAKMKPDILTVEEMADEICLLLSKK